MQLYEAMFIYTDVNVNSPEMQVHIYLTIYKTFKDNNKKTQNVFSRRESPATHNTDPDIAA